ncbi:TPM domain-containing protein [Streptomyces sp. NPDC046821]|uniref:TPM domain-containing protein n=1 Tax=Streptomyces sp. NPDC046821 TaxID=3154702 RepID=UPI0033CEE78F
MTSPPRVRMGTRSAGAVVLALCWAVPPAATARADARLLAAVEPGTSAPDLALPLIAAGGAVTIAALSYARRRRRMNTRTTPGGGARVTPLPDLDRRARRILVESDDAIRTSAEELGLADAQFGGEAVKTFAETVAFARSEVTTAFLLRRQLDDVRPGDDVTKRRLLDEIIGHCTEAGRALDAEAADFDRLRDLEDTVPEALAHAEAAATELAARTATAGETLTALRSRYAHSAVLPVEGHVEQAKDRLLFATTNFDQARDLVGSGGHGRAAAFLRAAESALGQARTFVDGVDRRGRELADADAKLPAALTASDAVLAAARAFAQGRSAASTGVLHGRVVRVESVDLRVRRALAAGPYDPVDALRRVEEADAALDAALTEAGEGKADTARLRGLLDRAELAARSSFGAASDFVETHRGAVGCEARMCLAEAGRELGSAGMGVRVGAGTPAEAGGNPATALDAAQRADSLARQALYLAQQDVRFFGSPHGGDGGGVGGAILGGIILGEARDDGRPGDGPWSFGGPETRGRRGGGGRY